MKKAVQQIMLGTVTKNEKQTAETLRRIKAAGYGGIEPKAVRRNRTERFYGETDLFSGADAHEGGGDAGRKRRQL